MFYQSSEYSFLGHIKQNMLAINDELAAFSANTKIDTNTHERLDRYSDTWVHNNGFHSSQIGIDIRQGSSYGALTIFKRDARIETFDIPRFFPQTLSLLEHIPNLHFAGFFIMNAGAHLAEHSHTRKHLIYHLLLNDLINGESELLCNGKTLTLSHLGDDALFDYSFPHSSANHAENARVNFVVDFNPWETSKASH